MSGRSSAAIRCSVPRIAHVRTIERRSPSAASTVAASASRGNVSGADADGEQRRGAVLGLDADELPDDLGGVGGLRAREPLRVEPVAADRVGRQGTVQEDPARPVAGFLGP